MSETRKITSSPWIYSVNPALSNTFLGVEGNALANVSNRSVLCLRETPADLNDAVDTGFYYVYNPDLEILNVPKGVYYGSLLVLPDGARYGLEFVQVLFSVATPPAIYVRKKGSSSGFGSWYSLNITELESGGVKRFASISYEIQQKGGGVRDGGDEGFDRGDAEEFAARRNGLERNGCRRHRKLYSSGGIYACIVYHFKRTKYTRGLELWHNGSYEPRRRHHSTHYPCGWRQSLDPCEKNRHLETLVLLESHASDIANGKEAAA